MPYGLVFDVDGVIADTEPLSSRACSAAFRSLYGIEVPSEAHLAYMGSTPRKHVIGLAKQFNVRIDVDEAIATHKRFFLDELAHAEDIAMPGVTRLIEDVRRYGEWRLALATGSSRERSEATIARAGLHPELFSVWVTADDIEKPKPDPEIYLRVASELGLFPTQCVVLEDSVAGVAAAKAASMRCIAVTNTFPGEQLRRADRIVDSISEVDVTMLYDLVVEG